MNDQGYLTAKQVHARYGITDMTLWRWLNNSELNFPRPIVITKRRYFKVDEVLEWERSRAIQAAA
ncbi:DNA-binding protein [Mesorhizobium sp.]|uniref:helix-turn-helix transcriptional regulator n=1 Tax=Mesorhizobium sp. TaxID=1871066 RepID=UPI000FE68493|nr:DNA-binding protein [Mesorhizobium sp.]RWP80471.1 MAG: DNA-binding protein [Mesorhizobium sp.]